MWLLYARAPVPDAPHWPGRRLLALLDAGAWPGLIAALVSNSPLQTGVVGSLALVLCALALPPLWIDRARFWPRTRPAVVAPEVRTAPPVPDAHPHP